MQLRGVEFLGKTEMVIGCNFDLLLSVQKVHVDLLHSTFEMIIIDVSSHKTKVRK